MVAWFLHSDKVLGDLDLLILASMISISIIVSGALGIHYIRRRIAVERGRG